MVIYELTLVQCPDALCLDNLLKGMNDAAVLETASR